MWVTFAILLTFSAFSIGFKIIRKEKSSGFVEKSSTRLANGMRKLLPQLPPHPDDAFILEFITDGAEGVAKMEPLVKEMEKKFKIKIRKINLTRSPDAMALFDFVGGNEGGNVPFFYNRRTAQAICGTTFASNLESLIMSGDVAFFASPELEPTNDYDPENQRSTGFQGYLEMQFDKFAKKASKKFWNSQKSEEGSGSSKPSFLRSIFGGGGPEQEVASSDK